MAFYKLFYIIHRRTDWNILQRHNSELMLPELYAMKKQRARESLMKFTLTTKLLYDMVGHSDGW